MQMTLRRPLQQVLAPRLVSDLCVDQIKGKATGLQNRIPLLSPTSTLKQDHGLAGPERRHVILSCGTITTQREGGREGGRQGEPRRSLVI